MDLTIRPQCSQWRQLLERRPEGSFQSKTLPEWRKQTRAELGLATDRPVIATGHQTLLWHPGILAKYLVADAFAATHDLATANLVVDQHVGEFGSFEIPIRKSDGSLGVRKILLCAPRPEVPMGRHEAFTPPPPETLAGAIPSVNEGVQRIVDAVQAHRAAPNAALQMAAAIADLMGSGGPPGTAPRHSHVLKNVRTSSTAGAEVGGRSNVFENVRTLPRGDDEAERHSNIFEKVSMSREGLVRPMPNVTATNLIGTSLANTMMQEMIADARRCAESYNRAVQSLPEAGIGELMIRDDYVELPLWRVHEDGKRMRAYDSDVEQAIRDPWSASGGTSQSSIVNRQSSIDLLPRALFMTALVRLGMCDLFIHGTGGANYDRAMELWIKDWLGLQVGSIAVVSANLRLPLAAHEVPRLQLPQAILRVRRMWHDPGAMNGSDQIGRTKRGFLAQINSLPRNSPQRKAMFLTMHEELANRRVEQSMEFERAIAELERAKRQASDFAIADRRDWAFPLYPRDLIDELAAAARAAVKSEEVTNPA